MDREKVVNGLETIKQFFGYGLPSTAEMFDSYYGILNDAIEMLKEQEEIVHCKDCHYRGLEERPILCQVMADDWFCADGRRKEETYEFKASCEDGSGTYRGT